VSHRYNRGRFLSAKNVQKSKQLLVLTDWLQLSQRAETENNAGCYFVVRLIPSSINQHGFLILVGIVEQDPSHFNAS